MTRASTITSQIRTDAEAFLNFLRSRFPLFDRSNIFLADLRYGTADFFAARNIIVPSSQTEEAAMLAVQVLEQSGILRKVNERTWTLNYPAYRTQISKSAAPAAARDPAAGSD